MQTTLVKFLFLKKETIFLSLCTSPNQYNVAQKVNPDVQNIKIGIHHFVSSTSLIIISM